MMSKGVSGTSPQAAPQLYDHIRALLRAGKNDDAIVKLCAIVVIRPDDLVAKELLFDAFFQKRDWLPALALAEELARCQPDIARLQKALIATLSNMTLSAAIFSPPIFKILFWRPEMISRLSGVSEPRSPG